MVLDKAQIGITKQGITKQRLLLIKKSVIILNKA
jgi:hypothetical protein